MEFEDQEEQEEELDLAAASYDSLGNSSRVKMPTSLGAGESVLAHPGRNSSHTRPRYRECLKNHAVGLGGHALDGCGEFMAARAEGTLDALKCAACNCHRNFHRKETYTVGVTDGVGLGDSYLLAHHQPLPHFFAYYRTPACYFLTCLFVFA